MLLSSVLTMLIVLDVAAPDTRMEANVEAVRRDEERMLLVGKLVKVTDFTEI